MLAADPPRLQLQLLGRFGMTDAAGDPVVLKSRRARGLLAYLYLQQRQAESRGKLCGLLWSDRAEPQARASLRQCLSDLRAALPPAARDCIVVEREAVRLDGGALCADTSVLDEAIVRGCAEDVAALLKRAAASPLLEDLDLPGLFSDWLQEARAHFDRQLALGVHALLTACEARRDWPPMRELAEAYLRRDPVDEVVAAALMRAETALGDTSAARRRFQSLRSALDKTFGAAPGADALAALTFAPGPAVHSKPRPVEGRPARAKGDPASGPPLVVVAEVDGAHLDGDNRALGGIVKGEIIAGLSGFRDFRVTSTSADASELDGEAWRQRGAAYVFGGRLWRSQNGLCLTAQLIRLSNRHVIWSERIQVSQSQITEAVDHIIAKVVGAVSPTIDADLERDASTCADSQYARYVAARGLAKTAASFEQAQDAAARLEALISEDPEFVLPYLPLARLYNTDFGFTRPLSSGAAERARAFSLAKTALSRDRGHIYAYTIVGWCHLRRGEWEAARAHLEQALALNPFHAERIEEVGFGFFSLGDLDRAHRLMNRCLLLSPTPKDSHYTDLALLKMMREDYSSSSRYLDFIAGPAPWALLYRAMNATLSGRPDAELGQAFLNRAAAMWGPDAPFTPDAVVSWIHSQHPFAPQDLRTRFLDGVRQTLF